MMMIMVSETAKPTIHYIHCSYLPFPIKLSRGCLTSI